MKSVLKPAVIIYPQPFQTSPTQKKLVNTLLLYGHHLLHGFRHLLGRQPRFQRLLRRRQSSGHRQHRGSTLALQRAAHGHGVAVGEVTQVQEEDDARWLAARLKNKMGKWMEMIKK